MGRDGSTDGMAQNHQPNDDYVLCVMCGDFMILFLII
jgi:hypothetical protein